MTRKIWGTLFFVVLLCFGTISMSFATDSLWSGDINSDFETAGNWTNNTVPNDLAEFSAATQSTVTLSSNLTINSLQFDAPAPSYNLANSTGTVAFNGAGIVNNSTQTLSISNPGTLVFNNSATSSNSAVTVDNSKGAGTLIFNNTSSAGQTVFTPAVNTSSVGGAIQFNNFSTAGSAWFQVAIASSSVPLLEGFNVQFNDYSNAGASLIGGQAIFSGHATASNSSFNSAAKTVSYFDSSSAGNSRFIQASLDTIDFHNSSTAGTASIDTGGLGANYITFSDNSTAGNSNISSNNSIMAFYGAASAGRAVIVSVGQGNDAPPADVCENASSILSANTNLIFCGSSSASKATIENLYGSIVRFSEDSSAGSATLTNESMSSTTFHDASSAGFAIITDSEAYSATRFYDAANAGNATISNVGSGNIVQFNNESNAANATIFNAGGGLVQFNNSASGGMANIINDSGTLDVSNLSSSQLTLGSVSGAGTILLGNTSLTEGGNGTDTSVSGTISGNGGSLVKVGTGTLTLTGTNSYTGGTTIGGGTLNISSDNNLGNGGGVTLQNGGILQTAVGITSSRGVTLGSGGGTIDTDGNNSSWQGQISGTGALTKAGAGTLTISGTNNYAGGTLINGGILQASSANALPGSGTVTLANASGAGLDLNGFNQTIGSLSGGGSSGGDVTLGSATLTTGSDNTSSIFGGSLSGSGDLVKIGTGTLTLSGTNIYTGTTTVSSGDLNLTGSLRGGAVVDSSAAFSNTGTMGGLINQGAVTPGINGVGNLTVNAYSGSGALNIIFNKSSFNSLVVTGSATLTGGSLNITGINFVSGQYNVITASAIVGSFATINTPAPSYFLTIGTAYTPTEVQLLINSLSFSNAAQSGNQQGVAAALDAAKPNATGDFAGAIQALYALSSAAQARSAYDQISGDSLAAFQNTVFHSAEVFTNQMMDRAVPGDAVASAQIAAPVQVAYAGDLTPSAIGTNPPSKESVPVPAYGLWSRGLGYFDHVDGNSSIGSPGSDATTGGFQAGYDFQVADNVLFGFSGGYAETSLTVDNRSSSGNSTSIQSGIYASYTPGPWFVNGSMAYTTSSNNMTRPIQFPGIDEQANANFQSRVYTTYVEAGYDLNPRKGFTLQPLVSLRQSHLDQNAFTESGAPGLDLTVQNQTVDSLVSALGGRLSREFFAQTSHAFTLGARAAWEHELENIDNSITAQFADAPAGGPFTVQGTPRSRNAAAIGLDARVNLAQNLQGFANGSALLGSDQNTLGLFGGFRWSW